jgi:hypothetical protein
MPPLMNLYQGPQYIDVVERNVSPPDSVPLVSTYVWNFDTSELYGTQEDKGELSLDQKIGSVGFIFTGWMAHAEGTPRTEELPAVIQRYEWTDWPNAGGSHPIDTIYSETPGTAFYHNAGEYTRYGLELTGVTKRLERISTSFRVTGAYTRAYTGAEGLYMSSPKQIQLDPADVNSKQYIYPFYYYTKGWEQKLILDYSADWLIKKLGMWVTFFVQQTLFDWDKNYEDPIRDVPMYYDPLTGNVVYITPEQSQAYGLSRQYDECDLSINKAPNDRVLFNINVSKSIGRGAEISFFVHNVFDDPATYENCYGTYSTRNPEIFYGVEFSMIMDEIWKRTPSASEEK